MRASLTSRLDPHLHGQRIDQQQIDAALLRAHQLRSQAFADIFAGLARRLVPHRKPPQRRSTASGRQVSVH